MPVQKRMNYSNWKLANLFYPDTDNSIFSAGNAPYDLLCGEAIARMCRNLHVHSNKFSSDCVAAAKAQLERKALGDGDVLEYLSRYAGCSPVNLG